MSEQDDNGDGAMARVACQEARAQHHRELAEQLLASAVGQISLARTKFHMALHEESLYRREINLAIAEGEAAGILPELPLMPDRWIRDSIAADPLFEAVLARRDPWRPNTAEIPPSAHHP